MGRDRQVEIRITGLGILVMMVVGLAVAVALGSTALRSLHLLPFQPASISQPATPAGSR